MRIINTQKAPEAIGPYSQAIKVDNMLFCSGQIPLDPKSMQIVGETIREQTLQVFKNIKAVLASQGLTLANIVKTSVFLSDMDNFTAMNQVYANEFGTHKPARSCVQVARNPKDVLIEIECIAHYNP